MFCTNCGQEISNTARFCSQCGQGTGVDAGPTLGYQAPRRLHRLMYDKSVAGVCAGIAKYLDVDVTLIRVLVVAVTFFTGVIPGVIAYLIAMAIMPKDYGNHRVAPPVTATPAAG
jgi:phage shock protein C